VIPSHNFPKSDFSGACFPVFDLSGKWTFLKIQATKFRFPGLRIYKKAVFLKIEPKAPPSLNPIFILSLPFRKIHPHSKLTLFPFHFS